MFTRTASAKAAVLGLFLFVLVVPGLWAQPSGKGVGGRRLPDVKSIDQEKGKVVIEAFRNQRLQGDFVFRFDLEHAPYRGETQHYAGILMGTWNLLGPRNRVDLSFNETSDRSEVCLLIQGGWQPEVWRFDPSQSSAIRVDADVWLTPLLEGFIYTPFDILMPFIFWQDFEYEGSERVRSRPAHLFRMYPPAAFKAEHPEIQCVRLSLDARYNALLSAEVLDNEEQIVRQFRVVSFEEVNDQYIVKTLDLVDQPTRAKTRIRITQAAVGMQVPAHYFSSESMGTQLPDLSPFNFKQL